MEFSGYLRHLHNTHLAFLAQVQSKWQHWLSNEQADNRWRTKGTTTFVNVEIALPIVVLCSMLRSLRPESPTQLLTVGKTRYDSCVSRKKSEFKNCWSIQQFFQLKRRLGRAGLTSKTEKRHIESGSWITYHSQVLHGSAQMRQKNCFF